MHPEIEKYWLKMGGSLVHREKHSNYDDGDIRYFAVYVNRDGEKLYRLAHDQFTQYTEEDALRLIKLAAFF
jgi:hypothetical protein